MAFSVSFDRTGATPFRPATSPCLLLIADAPIPAGLRDVTGAGAVLETSARPAIGSAIALRHAQAGTIAATVAAHTRSGLQIAFERDETTLGFALAVFAAGLGGVAVALITS